MPAVGYLSLASPRPNEHFRQALERAGYVEGKNVVIEHRGANGQLARMEQLAAELVSRQVAVIVALDTPSISAAKAVSTTRPGEAWVCRQQSCECVHSYI
jgi:putative tryptophan/tyrosine transport system substrate-binding protein